MEDPFTFKTIWLASVVHLPAVAMMIAISTLLIGLAQKATAFNWFYLVYGFLTLYLGGIFQLPDWMDKLSPFGFVSKLPIEDMNWLNAAGLIVVALVLIIGGINGYVSRDIES